MRRGERHYDSVTTAVSSPTAKSAGTTPNASWLRDYGSPNACGGAGSGHAKNALAPSSIPMSRTSVVAGQVRFFESKTV
jgi:hypothetical protein